MPSPMYLATTPSDLAICSAQQRWKAPMISRSSSGSSRVERGVEPTRSQNMTVSWRRWGASARVASLDSAASSSSAIARNILLRCPSETPIFSKSASVRSGRMFVSISLSAKRCAYCPSPSAFNHSAIGGIADTYDLRPTQSPRTLYRVRLWMERHSPRSSVDRYLQAGSTLPTFTVLTLSLYLLGRSQSRFKVLESGRGANWRRSSAHQLALAADQHRHRTKRDHLC